MQTIRFKYFVRDATKAHWETFDLQGDVENLSDGVRLSLNTATVDELLTWLRAAPADAQVYAACTTPGSELGLLFPDCDDAASIIRLLTDGNGSRAVI